MDLKTKIEAEIIYRLLKQATIAPIGNLRIKESVPDNNELVQYFALNDVVNRQYQFLEYANQRGVMVGGATGAGGEAPKLLLRRNADLVWIDNQQSNNDPSQYYLVKYPRGNYSPIDCDILRAEYHYYQELTALGFNCITTAQMQLIEGERYPSLWLPRFDIEQNANGQVTQRYAVESVYSMLRKSSGFLNHFQTLNQLIETMRDSGLQYPNCADFVLEWVKRDLLNVAFGNSDNHGRNTSFLRDEKNIWLSPIYDFAPMRADPEMIVRSTTWGEPYELAGEYRFDLIAEKLSSWIEPSYLLQQLQLLAEQLVELKTRLTLRGVPPSILNHPALAFDYLPDKLKKWGLI